MSHQKNLPSSLDHKKDTSQKKLFIEHFNELKLRLLFCLCVFLIVSTFGYFLRDFLLAIIVRPLGQTLYYTSPAGGFSFTLSISFLFGFIISIPVLVYNLFRFIEPAIPDSFKYSVFGILLSAYALMSLGVGFAYFISLPAALYFLQTVSSSGVESLISASEYFSFVSRYLLGFGLLFQFPLILMILNRVKPLSFKDLISFQKWVVLGSFIMAAILTPTPDFFNQSVMAFPLIVLYQVSILIIVLKNRAKRKS